MTEAPPRNAWALMKSGPFSRLWRAGLVSSTGDWVSILAAISLGERLAGSGGIVLVLVSRILPGLFFGAVGGVIADRLNRKRVMLFTEFGRGGLVLLLAFVDTIGQLILVNLLLEALTLTFQPAKEATVPTLVEKNELVQANSLSLSAAYGTFPLGAAIFWLVTPFAASVTFGVLPGTEEGLAFVVDSFTYIISGLILTTLPRSARREAADPGRRDKKRKLSRLLSPLRDVRDGVVFVATHPRIRPVVVAMTVALAGGGIVIVLGKPFAANVLQAGASGFPALLTAFGLGAGIGIVMVTIFGPRFQYKDVMFAFALLLTGTALASAGFVQTIIGGVGWIFVMGYGAGSAYVLGFAHLHEQTEDEIRGRTFAALFSLMRIGLLTSMAIALPASELADGWLPGLLSEGSRVVLLAGGSLMILAGVSALWTVRKTLIDMGKIEKRPSVEAATEAFRNYRKAVSGGEETDEMDLDELQT
jgi:dTMP kinase